MSSIISSFEYDIFISYRHNDNPSGWVTEFVNALQEELAATIKEPLNIYFNKNSPRWPAQNPQLECRDHAVDNRL